MLMVLGVIRNGNGLSYATLIIGLQSGTVLASFPSFISTSVSSSSSSFSLANNVQLQPPSSVSGSGGAGSTSPSLGSSSGASLPSSSLSSPSSGLASSSSSSSSSASSSSSSSSSLPSFVPQSNTPSPPCDFDTYETTGCEDDEGSYCDTNTQKCTCKDDHPIRLLGYCLKIKQIGEECYTSAQCKSINNAACYIFGKEYDNERISGGHNVGRQVSNWPTGNCRCNLGHQWDNVTESCIKKTIGSWCNDDWDCIKEKYNTQCSRPQNLCECAWGFFYDAKTDSCQTPKLWGQKCISNVDCEAENFICSQSTFKCVCPSGFHFDPIHPGCKINADSSCDRGYRWDEDWGRCIPVRSAASAFPFNSLTGVNILGSRTKSTSLDRSNDHSGSSVHSSKPDSNNDSGSSSVTTALILILPNVIAFALILRYCYYRKREEDSSDLTDDLERGNFAIRSAHLHNLTKFCAYPPYTTRTILPGGSIKAHHGTCLGTTVVGYPGDMAIGTCCVANVTATGKVVHGKSTLEAVEETDEPIGSLNQESPEGEICNSVGCNSVDGNDKNKSSSSPVAGAGEVEEQTNNKKKDDFTTISSDDVGLSTQVDSSQRINSPLVTATRTASPTTSSPTFNSNNGIPVVKSEKNESDLATPDGTCVKQATTSTSGGAGGTAFTSSTSTSSSTSTCISISSTSTSTTTPTLSINTSPKVTVVKYSPTKPTTEVVVKGGEELEPCAVNVESTFTSPLNTHFACDGSIDRQSSHFILKESTSDGPCLFTSSSSNKSSPVTSSSPAMSPCTRKHSTSTDDELPVQGANST